MPNADERYFRDPPHDIENSVMVQPGQQEDLPLMGGRDDGMIMTSYQPEYIRREFVKKVYGILMCQMIVTMMIAAPFYLNKAAAQDLLGMYPGLMYLAVFSNLAFLCFITCNPHEARKTPTNYALLAGFTISQGVLIGVVCLFANAVIAAWTITCVVVMVLTAYAWTTKTDFTGIAPYLLVGLVCLLGVGLTSMLFPDIPYVSQIYGGLGAALFAMYIVHDTQIIVGGKNVTYQICIDDYAFAALVLYLDIINFFLSILNLLGGGRD